MKKLLYVAGTCTMALIVAVVFLVDMVLEVAERAINFLDEALDSLAEDDRT